MTGLYVLVAGLCVEGLQLVASSYIIGVQRAVVLVAVQFEKIERLAVRSPRDIGKVAVGRVANIQIDGLLCFQIKDADGNLMRGHACHGILVGFQFSLTLEGVHLRIVGYHTLVHAVEGQFLAILAPEGTFVDAELIAVNALAIDNLA